MEIYNNNIPPVSQEKVSIQKKTNKNSVESKTAEANSLNALASYGMAQVNSCSFKGNSVKQEIEIPKESRMNIINLLGITDKEEIKRLLNFTGFQFALASLFLYTGATIEDAESSLDGKIESIKEDEETEELVEYWKKSKNFLIDEPQKVMDFVKYMRENNVNFDDKTSVVELLLVLNESTLPYTKELIAKNKYTPSEITSFITPYTQQTEDFIREIESESESQLSVEDKLKIVSSLTPENVEIAKQLTGQNNSEYNPEHIQAILYGTNNDTIDFVKEVLSNKSLSYNAKDKSRIIRSFKKENLDIAQKLLYNPNQKYTIDDIVNILCNVNDENKNFAAELISDESENKFPAKNIGTILFEARGKTLDFVQNFIKHNKRYTKEDKIKIISYSLNEKNMFLAQRLINMSEDKQISADTIDNVLIKTSFDDSKIEFANYLINLHEKNEIDIAEYTDLIDDANEETINLLRSFMELPKEKRCDGEVIHKIISSTKKYNEYDYLSYNNKPSTDKIKLDFAKYLLDLYKNSDLDLKVYCGIVSDVQEETMELIKKMLEAPKEKRYSCNDMHEMVFDIKDFSGCGFDSDKEPVIDKDKLAFAMLFAQNSLGFDMYTLRNLISNANKEKRDFVTDVIQSFDKTLTDEEKKDIIGKYSSYEKNSDKMSQLQKLVKLLKEGEIPKGYLFTVLNEKNNITLNDVKQLERIMGADIVRTLSSDELVFAVQFKDICNKQNINEIPLYKKKDFLRTLVASNTGLFNVSENLKKYFPLLPKTQEEYCTLLPALVRSLGIETNTLSDAQTKEFNTSLVNLGNTLKGISDEEFSNIKITQEYPKSEFIKDTFNTVKDLSPQERQKVYDYFGFELHHNKRGTQVDDKEYHRFSISGYPVNLNNGKKLAQITDPHTKEIVEQLREKVIKFSQNNKILCNNAQVESELNKIVNAFPEIRTQIERVQHGAHCYDIMQHSLKVMQKIVQTPEFEKLSDSDKRTMLICALFHDGNKAEGIKDKLHAEESAFDAFYIINKLNLPREEKIKIYSLIKHHEWLGYVNNNELYKLPVPKKQQSVAFDLQYDNLFDMAKLFTIADLKAVKKDDEFYIRFKNDFETHSKEIDDYIKELKKTQPLLPVTKIPNASKIEKALTSVNEDGSTNIKGVYKDKNGMIIIKFNEVENNDWEHMGFSKGSVSKGITAKGISNKFGSTEEVDVDTGNIKFFVHGLDYSNQLAKFDAFALPDSEALLSVSYTERPESKYRFFRPQGVLLDADTKYTHGGGNTDAGSGCGKDINNFKDNYIFGGERESDRKYVSELIKDALNLSDEEYAKFVIENADKSLSQIKPKETADKIVKALATINSNTRKGNRAYNEMYISNPRVMGVFAYPPSDKVGDIMQFIDTQPDFLKQYALDKDLPFIVFGD